MIATKTDWFQKAWKNSWKWIKESASNVWDWLKKVPGWIKDAFKKISSYITTPFKAAFNAVADTWNNTVGRLNWTTPWWIGFPMGGRTIKAPQIPKFHSGGTVPGAPGSEMLAILQGGEKVSRAGMNDHSEMLHVTLMLDTEILGEGVTKFVNRRGGNVQISLGGRNG